MNINTRHCIGVKFNDKSILKFAETISKKHRLIVRQGWAITLLIFILPAYLLAQDSSYIIIANPFADKELFLKNGEIKHAFLNADEKNNYLQSLLFNLYDNGYLTANYSSYPIDSQTENIAFNKGLKIKWASISTSGIDKVFLSGAGFNPKDFKGHIFRYTEVVYLMENFLKFSEMNGHPFATVQLDSIELKDSILFAHINFQKNRVIKFSGIDIQGNLQLNKNYMQQYTGIETGALYNEALVADLDAKLKEMPFASIQKSSQIQFSGEEAKVIVFLDEKKINKFDFLIGVLPNNEITGRLIVTGEGILYLQNTFKQGEIINLHFSKLQASTKELNLQFTYPYLPKLPLGVDASFNLFLNDTTYLERRSSLGIIYQFIGNNYVKAFTSLYQSNILQVDTNYIIITKTLPPNLDISTTSYGLAWNYEKLNYRYNPRYGFAIYVSASAGTRKVAPNPTITALQSPDFDFNSLYDSIDIKSTTLNYTYHIQYFQPIFKRSTLLFSVQGADLVNNQVFQNELFRLGGTSLLRGFDEKSVYVSQYHLGTVEFRYLLSQNSYASIFTDIAYTENRSIYPIEKDFPYGFGAGVTFETKAGIFGVSYALGSQQGNPIQIKTAKIHFGYVNYF